MAAHAGEKAWNTGTFKCQVCNQEVRVRKGAIIPQCPDGHSTFDERLNEPGREKPLTGHPRKRSRAGRTRSSGRKRSARPSGARRRRTARKSTRSSRASRRTRR
jgi:hypothetical protein